MVFVIPHHNVPYILEVIQNILAVVVESHFTTLFLIKYIGFHGMVVPGTLHDSLYLLDVFLNQTSGLEPKQIMTDTAGYSDLVFKLFGLLGFQFSPRIANNHGTKLWRIDLTADYKMLNEVSQNKINTARIEKNWSEILRVAGSLKSGKVNATELGKALIEYGKVYKTKHQLRYISDEIYTRQILEQLNKGEARHTLCRHIFYGKKKKTRNAVKSAFLVFSCLTTAIFCTDVLVTPLKA